MSSMSESSFDSEEEYEGILKKAVDVELPFDFNPNSVPQNGTEYLHHVIYERSKCKKLVISNIDPNKYQSNQTITVPIKKNVTNTCEKYIPTKEWQLKKLDDFRYFKNIIEYKSESKFEPNVATFNEDEFLKTLVSKGPKFSQFLRYTQSAKIRMLEIIAKYFNSAGNNWKIDSVGEWVFAILVTLTLPLSPSCCHVIREFTRMCQTIRSQCSQDINEADIVPLNFYICICSQYFRQLDLAD